MTTAQRLQLLAECAHLFQPWTGGFDAGSLSEWIVADLGHPEALDRPVDHGPIQSLAQAPRPLLHVVSQNTPHAAFQSLLRGLVIGAHNIIKLPSSGLPEFEKAVARLPSGLSSLVELVDDLLLDWADWAEVVTVFGSDETIAWFAAHTPAHVRLVPHGQALSIALVEGDLDNAARLAARDVSLFDQRGCLSVHDVYVGGEAGLPARDFAALLAEEMGRYNRDQPRSPLPAAASGALTSLRESIRFAATSDPDRLALWESEGNTDWTVVYDATPEIKLGPLNRFVYVKPWPCGDPAPALGPERRHLASLALHPFEPGRALALCSMNLGATRICPLGETQSPSLFWHHGGLPSLASLIKWIDLG